MGRGPGLLAAAAAGGARRGPGRGRGHRRAAGHVDLAEDLPSLLDALADLLEHATLDGTRRAYATDWADFADRHQLTPLRTAPRIAAPSLVLR